jgi:5'-methylthioadenosine phosphorylase
MRDEPPVNWEEIVTIFKENAEKVTSVLVEVIRRM